MEIPGFESVEVTGVVAAEIPWTCVDDGGFGVTAAGCDTCLSGFVSAVVPVVGVMSCGADASDTGSRSIDGSHPVLGTYDSFGVTPIVSYNLV